MKKPHRSVSVFLLFVCGTIFFVHCVCLNTCMDRLPLIVCTTHLHTMKSYLYGREVGREGGRECDLYVCTLS